jgi:hypothetical protein
MDAFDHDRYRGRRRARGPRTTLQSVQLCVPVGVVRIWRLDRNLQTEKDDVTAEHVSPGLQAIGQQRKERPTIPAEIFATDSPRLTTIPKRISHASFGDPFRDSIRAWHVVIQQEEWKHCRGSHRPIIVQYRNSRIWSGK